MDKEQILSEIKTRVGQISLSDRTLTDYISAHLPEGEPDDAYYTKHVEFLKSLNGNYSHDVANEVNEFKKNYKPQPVEPKKEETLPKGDDELLKRLEALEKAYQEEKRANAINSIRAEVKGKATELKVANKAIWNDVVETIQVKDETTSEDLLAEVKKTYERKLKEYTGEGASPYGGSQRSGAPTISAEDAKAKVEAFKEKQRARGKLPKKD
jgi:hypothetical protein